MSLIHIHNNIAFTIRYLPDVVISSNKVQISTLDTKKLCYNESRQQNLACNFETKALLDWVKIQYLTCISGILITEYYCSGRHAVSLQASCT